MFKALKQILSSQSKSRRPKACVRLRATVEPLEWRCMLSIAPATIDDVLDRAAEYAPDFRDIPIVIDSGIVGRVGDYWQDLSPGDQTKWREIIADLTNPASGGISFPRPGFEIGGDDIWFELPGSIPHQNPSITLPDPSDVGGFTDITELNDPSNGTPRDQGSRDVADLLSSLQYLPRSLQENSNDSGVKKADGKLDSKTIAIPTTNLPASPADDHPEGGMVALTRETQLEEAAGTTSTAAADRHALWQLPVKMDQVYGKFQAFELSTGDEPAAATPAADAPTSSKPDSAINEVRDADVASSIEVIVPIEAPIPQVRTLAFLGDSLTLPDPKSDADADLEAIERPVLDPAATAIFIVSAASILRPSQARRIESYFHQKLRKPLISP